MGTIGARIANKRAELGMTQEDLAFKLGYKSRTSVAKIESDSRNLTQSKIKAIADALNTTPAYIMGWEDERIEKERIEKYNNFIKSDLNSLIFEEIQDLTNSQKYELIGIIKKMKNP